MCSSLMSPATQTSTPPIASDMLMTPVQRIAAAKSIFSPVSASTVLAVHASPPYQYETLIICDDIAEVWPPSGLSQAGIGTSMSRGNETTVTRRGLSVMCTSIVTSLRSPGESLFAQRGKSATSWPSHESVPAMSTSTPPSIAPSDGGMTSSSSSTTAFSPSARRRVQHRERGDAGRAHDDRRRRRRRASRAICDERMPRPQLSVTRDRGAALGERASSRAGTSRVRAGCRWSRSPALRSSR